MILHLKGGFGSGWHAPPKGTHSGGKHRAVGSGKAVKPSNGELVDFGDKWPHEGPNQWGYDKYAEWEKSLTENESDFALVAYTGAGFQDVNNHLRFGDRSLEVLDMDAKFWAEDEGWTSEQIKEFPGEVEFDYMNAMVRHLDSAIGKSKAPSDMVTYRGWGSGSEVGDLKVGETFSDSAYVSTSLSKRFVRKHFSSAEPIARIHIPKGHQAAFLGESFGVTNEAEVLLPRDLTFRVLSKTPTDIELEIVSK